MTRTGLGWGAIVLMATGCGAHRAADPNAGIPDRYLVFEHRVPDGGWTYTGDAGGPPARWCSSWRRGPDIGEATPEITMCGIAGRRVAGTPPPTVEALISGEINGLPAEWTTPGPDPHGVRLVQFDLAPDYAVSLVSFSVN